jgi:hypothetical protein
MDVVYSLASGALALALAGLAWLVAHSRQITSVLSFVPGLVKDVEALKARIDKELHPAATADPAQSSATPPAPPAV